jgi:hypothetical protein
MSIFLDEMLTKTIRICVELGLGGFCEINAENMIGLLKYPNGEADFDPCFWAC